MFLLQIAAILSYYADSISRPSDDLFPAISASLKIHEVERGHDPRCQPWMFSRLLAELKPQDLPLGISLCLLDVLAGMRICKLIQDLSL